MPPVALLTLNFPFDEPPAIVPPFINVIPSTTLVKLPVTELRTIPEPENVVGFAFNLPCKTEAGR